MAEEREIGPEDLASVGTRVSWGAIFAGAVVAVATFVALGLFTAAIGVTALGQFRAEAGDVAAGQAIALVVCLLVSLFIGGLVTSKTTAGETRGEAVTYGVLLWAVLFVFMLTTGAGAGAGIIVSPPQELRLAEGQQQQVNEAKAKVDAVTDNLSPTGMAWLGFGSIVLQILGAVTGAGPQLVLRRIQQRRALIISRTRVTA